MPNVITKETLQRNRSRPPQSQKTLPKTALQPRIRQTLEQCLKRTAVNGSERVAPHSVSYRSPPSAQAGADIAALRPATVIRCVTFVKGG